MNRQQFRPFSFAIVADMHTHLPGWHGREKLEWFVEWVSDRGDIEFVLVLGDLMYERGMPPWEQAMPEMRETLSRMGRPVHVVYGNNDIKLAPIEAYEAVWGPGDRTFEHGGCFFTLMWNGLTCVRGHGHQGYIRDAQWEWLEEQLRDARRRRFRHLFFVAHVPPLCPNWPNPKSAMRKYTEERLWAVCDQYKIAAAFFGHIHHGDEFTQGTTKVIVVPSLTVNLFPPPPGDRTQLGADGQFCVVHVHENGITHELSPVGSQE